MQLALLPPDVAVMVAVPAALAVTLPIVSTIATAVLLDVHVTVLSVASAGDTVAESGVVSPTVIVFSLGDTITEATGITLAVTVIVHVPDLPLPSAAVAVIVAVPAALAVTLPVVSTVATASLLDAHVTDLFVASVGDIAAESSHVSPTTSPFSVGLTFNASTFISSTFTVYNAVLGFVSSAPCFAVNVIIAVPAFLAVTFPVVASILATVESELLQDIIGTTVVSSGMSLYPNASLSLPVFTTIGEVTSDVNAICSRGIVACASNTT